MKKLSSSFKNMLLSLTIICGVAAALLAFVNDSTKETIAAGNQKTLIEGIQNVTPAFDNDPYADKVEVKVNGDIYNVYPSKKGGELVGVAVESLSHDGFSGDINILVGMDKESTIINYTVLQQAETPGLGAEMDKVFRAEGTGSNVLGLSLLEPLKVKKDGGTVDAITAATISSRAFLGALNNAQAAYKKAVDDNLIK